MTLETPGGSTWADAAVCGPVRSLLSPFPGEILLMQGSCFHYPLGVCVCVCVACILSLLINGNSL